MGDWKLIFPHTYRTLDGKPGGDGGTPVGYASAKTGLELYHLGDDVEEKHNVADEHPEVVKQLQAFAEKARAELGDSLQKRKGSGIREPGRLTDAEAKALETVHWPDGKPGKRR